MILEFDAGNTFVKWRLLSSDGQRVRGGRVRADELASLSLGDVVVQRARAGSVAGPKVDQALAGWVQERFALPLQFAHTQSRTGSVVNSYADPARMGVDRWLAMLAAYHAGGGPCCVVDCGSAVTVDLVAADGRHLGGYIMPGLRLLRDSLLRGTSRVLVDEQLESGLLSPGRSTNEAVGHGVNLMFAALADRIREDLKLRPEGQFKLWVTGGDGPLFRRLLGEGSLRDELVLDGLALALP